MCILCYVILIRCTGIPEIYGHLGEVIRGYISSKNMTVSRWPFVVFLLATRCQYWGFILPDGDRSSEKMIWFHRLFQMGSHWRHRRASCHWQFKLGGFRSSEGTPHLKTWPNSADHFGWALTEGIDQAILDLLLLTISCGGSACLRVHLVWKYEFISGLTLASQRSFLRKTNTWSRNYINTNWLEQ